jgi:hypothetical protein
LRYKSSLSSYHPIKKSAATVRQLFKLVKVPPDRKISQRCNIVITGKLKGADAQMARCNPNKNCARLHPEPRHRFSRCKNR